MLFVREHDYIFLLKLLAGAVLAIVILSGLMKYLLINHFSNTYALFFGLISISIIIPLRMLTSKRCYLLLFALTGAALTILLIWSVNPYTKV